MASSMFYSYFYVKITDSPIHLQMSSTFSCI